MTPLNYLVLAASLLLSILLASAVAQEREVAGGLRPDAPTYALRGSHPAGTRDLVIDGELPLSLTLWYPALNAGNATKTIAYAYEIKMDAPPKAVATVTGRALRDAPFDFSAGPYPLVILSPGFSIGRTSYAWLAEHLTSHGFVVLAPEHLERADPELSEFWRAAITRPQDTLRVLAYADEQVKTGGVLAGLVDVKRVAVIGHSYGGYTALMAAGARFDITGFEALCEAARKTEDPDTWLCDLIAPHIADMAELAGLKSVPEGLWPAWGDERVDAVVSMAGDAYLFGQTGLAEITVPVMALGGTADTGTPYGWGTQPTYDYVASPKKAKVSFDNAEHMIFASSCDALPWFAEIGFYEFCSDAVWDMDRAHDLVNHFATAFLLAELWQDTDAAAALRLDAVNFSGVTYEVQGF